MSKNGSEIARNILAGLAAVGLVVGATLGVQALVNKAKEEKKTDKTQEPTAAVYVTDGSVAEFPAEIEL